MCSVLCSKRKLSSPVDGLEVIKTTFDHKIRGHQYEYDGSLALKKKVSDTLKNLRSPVVDVRRHDELFRSKMSTYNNRFWTDFPISLHF